MDEMVNEDWLDEEAEEPEPHWMDSLLDFADWVEDDDTSAYDEGLEEALAEERIAALESELEQDENPLDAEEAVPDEKIKLRPVKRAA